MNYVCYIKNRTIVLLDTSLNYDIRTVFLAQSVAACLNVLLFHVSIQTV